MVNSLYALLVPVSPRKEMELASASTKKLIGFDEPDPGFRSAKSRVPPAVPSERHNSRPVTPSSAVKHNWSLYSKKSRGSEGCVRDSGADVANEARRRAFRHSSRVSRPVTASTLSKYNLPCA